MKQSATPRVIYLSTGDLARFRDVIATASHYAVSDMGLEQLKSQMATAVVRQAEYVPATAVTVGSRIRITDSAKGQTTEMRLSFPGDCIDNESSLSVLDPLGVAVLGANAGDTVEVDRSGIKSDVHIDDVVYQEIDLELS